MKRTIVSAGLLAITSLGIFTSAAYADGEVVIGAGSPPAIEIVPSTNCSPSAPCGTYAVVGANGTVNNIIVCQSVCGGGSFGGNTVVLQQPTDPNGSGNAQGGYFAGNNAPKPVTYDSSTRTFAVPMGPITSHTTTVIASDGSSTELIASVSDSIVTFNAPSSITDTTPVLSAPHAATNANGTLIASNNDVTNIQTFSPGMSVDEMMFIINNNLTNYLISSNSKDLIRLLLLLGY